MEFREILEIEQEIAHLQQNVKKLKETWISTVCPHCRGKVVDVPPQAGKFAGRKARITNIVVKDESIFRIEARVVRANGQDAHRLLPFHWHIVVTDRVKGLYGNLA